jgi:hypothetical protein
MLKWTCRLRDLFESKGYRTYDEHSQRSSAMREAEFVDGDFPEQFRWEIFKHCFEQASPDYVFMFNRDSVAVMGGHAPVVAAYNPKSKHIRSMCGLPITGLLQRKIDVFWISPTVFVSWISFDLEGDCLYDFKVEFTASHPLSCYVYSVSAFSDGRRKPSSSVAMRFFRHLISPLPANYFFTIRLHVDALFVDKRFLLDDFLSIIPHDAPQPPSRSADTPWTTFQLSLRDYITKDEFRVIFSHKFHPVVKFSFVGCCFDPWVSFDVFCDLLRQARFLRAVDLPTHLIGAKEEPKLRFKRIILKSQDLTASFSDEKWDISPALLHSFSTRHEVTDIRMECHEGFLKRGTNRRELRASIKPFFQPNSNLEQLTIQFYGPPCLDHGRLENVVTACLSRNLCFFNVSFNFCTIDGGLNRVQLWDHCVFPSLSVNYWRIKLKKPDTPISLAVRAINQGLIYRKTTDHVPYDATIAFAGVIFCVVSDGSRSLSKLSGTIFSHLRMSPLVVLAKPLAA